MYVGALRFPAVWDYWAKCGVFPRRVVETVLFFPCIQNDWISKERLYSPPSFGGPGEVDLLVAEQQS